MKLKNGANIVKNNLSQLREAMHRLTLKSVMVGIPSDKASRDEDTPLNNAAIGYIHEHGAPEMNIPARPFLIPGIAACKDSVVKQFSLAARRSIKGDAAAVEQGLNRAGLVAQNSVRRVINTGIAPALAESTLNARRRRGKTRTKPLIDSGQLRNAVVYTIRNK